MSVVDGSGDKALQGTVKFYDSAKGYGFIRQNDGSKDVFVHARELRRSKIDGDLDEGDCLSYETEETDRGLRAINISRL